MSWLKYHLEEFVYPIVGTVDLSVYPNYFTPDEKTVIKNIWKSAKREAKGKLILLPGRDTFVFEILARRENYPTLFMPECSRLTAAECRSKIPLRQLMLLDTGFMGSIPKELQITQFKLISHFIRSKFDNSAFQVFPNLTRSRSLALKIERTPKYWKRGYLSESEVKQDFSDEEVFKRAVALTCEIYKDSSPKFKAGHSPLLGWNRYPITKGQTSNATGQIQNA